MFDDPARTLAPNTVERIFVPRGSFGVRPRIVHVAAENVVDEYVRLALCAVCAHVFPSSETCRYKIKTMPNGGRRCSIGR